MLKIDELKQIIEMIDNSSINEFELEYEGTNIKLKKQTGIVEQVKRVEVLEQPKNPEQYEQISPGAKQVEQVEVTEKIDDSLMKITSPMVGTFYRSSSPDAEPFIKLGDKVEEKTVVCIVEAMKLFNEIEAEVKGEIVEILVEDGQLVEYGQPLFLVK